jgi:lipase chaperone LimK
MSGTRPDGDVRQDAAAHLVVDEELAHLFDYYLSALGEQPLPAIRAGIERELHQRLSAPAASEAVNLLDRYIAYKRALATTERAQPASADNAIAARARLDAMQRLRYDYFSPAEAAGLFGASDARDRETIALLEGARQETSGATARRATGQAPSPATSAIAAAERAERDAPVRILTLEATVQQARSRGADDNEVYRLRAAALSTEAAARLADLDREEADWQRRIAAYREARSRASATDAAALQQLRDAQFTPQEQKRLDAYE